MALKAIQQFAIRDALKNEKQARATLSAAKAAGYDAIEMCGFLTRKIPLVIRGFAAMAGMPIGPCCKLDWRRLLSEMQMPVVSLHEDLGSVLKSPETAAENANSFGTDTIVITGMFKFDYGDEAAVLALCDDLNRAGKALAEHEVKLLYHNHNCELCRIGDQTAYDLIIKNTDPELVNFEFDSYWPAEAGCNPLRLMEKLGSRMRLWHINDRGARRAGKTASIRRSDGMELGYGNMELGALTEKALALGVDAVVLECHGNWVDNDPVKSMVMSAEFLNAHIK